jgi:predicted RNase H-like HicB family nuclease
METVQVIMEKTNTGYSAYSPQADGVITVGDSIEETKTNMLEAIEMLIDTAKEFDESLPEILQGEYQVKFKIDVPTFFEWMSGVMTKSGIATIAGLNRDLVNQYANGIKTPGPKQLGKIEKAIHNLGSDLLSISF